ncbi:MAG: hypothetical protein V4616_03215 [Bacteroidota bacterium]
MKHVYLSFSALLISTLFFSGCSKSKQEATVPAYLRIDSIDFQGTSIQGTNNQNITEAWIFIDSDLQGIYDLPCEVPILALGSREVKIRGGIKRNGMGTSRVVSPFFSTYTEQLTFEPGKTALVKPVVGYFSDVEVWNESFEDAGGIQFSTTTNSDTTLRLTNAPGEVFEGYGSGKAFLPDGKTYMKFFTNLRKTLPKANPVFMELNYKCNDVVNVGLIAHEAGGDISTVVLYLKPTENDPLIKNGWNKIYINLSDQINLSTASTQFDIFFELRKQSSSGTSYMLLDNVKLVYPE